MRLVTARSEDSRYSTVRDETVQVVFARDDWYLAYVASLRYRKPFTGGEGFDL